MLCLPHARSVFRAASVASVLAFACACTPTIGFGEGGGGANVTTTATAGPVGPASTSGTASGETSATSSSAGTGGGGPSTEFLYKGQFSALGVASWEKIAISAAFPNDANAPTSGIVSAVRLQNFDWMLWITSDGLAHVALNGVWQAAVPIDAAFGTGIGCKKINQHLVNTSCVNDTIQPDCQPLSTLTGYVISHVPGNGCGNQPQKEGVSLSNSSIATLFDVTGPSGTVSYVGQRDFLTDCYPEAPGSASAPVWAFQIARPTSCPGDWYDSYLFRANQQLYLQKAADLVNGMNTTVWSLDASNPLMNPASDPNRPELPQVTAAYYENATSKVVLIAP